MFWGFIFEKEDGDMLEKRIRLSATLCSKRQQNHLATLSVCVGDNARVALSSATSCRCISTVTY